VLNLKIANKMQLPPKALQKKPLHLNSSVCLCGLILSIVGSCWIQ
jgi:hypothetical protein